MSCEVGSSRMNAIARWKEKVTSHHVQSIRAQGGREPEDFWRPFAAHFRENPRRTDDPVVNRLLREIQPQTTVLDVGGGGGRFALPLALQCHQVTVVEPSGSMVETLLEEARLANVRNLSVVKGQWEVAEVEPTDIVLCAHVLYGVEDVQPFIHKLVAHAKDQVLILMFMDSPQSHLSLLWQDVHREERVNLPGLPDLLVLLWEMDIYPHLEMVHTMAPRVFETWEQAREEFRLRLYVAPGTQEDRLLSEAMVELVDKSSEGLVLRGARPRRLGLLSWRGEAVLASAAK